jgi:hypothetical protein
LGVVPREVVRLAIRLAHQAHRLAVAHQGHHQQRTHVVEGRRSEVRAQQVAEGLGQLVVRQHVVDDHRLAAADALPDPAEALQWEAQAHRLRLAFGGARPA